VTGAALERKLYLLRKQAERRVRALAAPGPRSTSRVAHCRTVVYKGLLMGGQVWNFMTI